MFCFRIITTQTRHQDIVHVLSLRGYTNLLWKLRPSRALRISMYSCFLLQVHQRFTLRVLSPWTCQAEMQPQQNWKAILGWVGWARTFILDAFASERQMWKASGSSTRCVAAIACSSTVSSKVSSKHIYPTCRSSKSSYAPFETL